MAHFFGTIWPYLVAILLFLVMIVIHEFGHFLAAKLMGVRVNEFSVGFGPALFKKQGKETLLQQGGVEAVYYNNRRCCLQHYFRLCTRNVYAKPC